jgi:hypothetical protein
MEKLNLLISIFAFFSGLFFTLVKITHAKFYIVILYRLFGFIILLLVIIYWFKLLNII